MHNNPLSYQYYFKTLCCDIIAGHKVRRFLSIFSLAVIINCFDDICFLLEGCCDSTDLNATDNSMRTPSHLAYL